MTKFSLLGILSCVAGALLIGFQFLSSIIGTEDRWESLAIADLGDGKYIAWIDRIPINALQKITAAVAHMPLFIFLFCLGGFFFVLGHFWGKK